MDVKQVKSRISYNSKVHEDGLKPMSILIASDLDGWGVLHKLGPFVIELNIYSPNPGVAEAKLGSW